MLTSSKTLEFFASFMLLPFVLGLAISYSFQRSMDDWMDRILQANSEAASIVESKLGASPLDHSRVLADWHEACFGELLHLLSLDSFPESARLSLFPNGGHLASSCQDEMASSISLATLNQHMRRALASMDDCPSWSSSYHVESFWTRVFAEVQLSRASQLCWEETASTSVLLRYCDAGSSKTPVLFDHQRLVPIRDSLPCHFHTHSGKRLRILSAWGQWLRESAFQEVTCSADGTCPSEDQALLYAVPAGRHFMYAPRYVGEIIRLPHVPPPPDSPSDAVMHLKALSIKPRVLEVVNFFSDRDDSLGSSAMFLPNFLGKTMVHSSTFDQGLTVVFRPRKESAELVERAKHETKEAFRIKRSSTGATGYNTNNLRTSESGYDTQGPTAMKIKQRCFQMLGMDWYIEQWADGLQILRYNATTAYSKHLDWISGSDTIDHNFDSAGVGTNRFATVLLYMSDLEPHQGGETVFTEADPPEEQRVTWEDALQQLRESEYGSVLKHGSWEERLAATCRSRLSIQPRSARAILFYSQLPNGEMDSLSYHGACPVLQGQKYAANLWVWNGVRNGYSDNPKNPKYRKR